MTPITLDEVLRDEYASIKMFIRDKNVEAEREFFSTPNPSNPVIEMMCGKSYEENFNEAARTVEKGGEYAINQVFAILQEVFLFSAGHDMMFKTKLKADIYMSTPIDSLIYPRLEKAVKARYNDISVIQENPNREANIQGIQRLVHLFMELQSLLYLVYYHEYQFPSGWEGLFSGMDEEIIAILKEDGMTIGELETALIEEKCSTMKSVLINIKEPNLRRKFLQKVEDLKMQKLEETSTFTHIHLPVTYFLDHTFSDFLHESNNSSVILGEQKPGKPPKIILPNTGIK